MQYLLGGDLCLSLTMADLLQTRLRQNAADTTQAFLDNSVAAQSTNGSKAPKKAAPKESASTKASSGGGFFDSSVGSQFANRSESPKKAAPKQAAPTKAAPSGKLFAV